MKKGSRPVGRPPRYSDVAAMQSLIDAYFEQCKGTLLRDDDGHVELNKYGEPVILDAHPPTIPGLAFALGFTSRQSLLNYQGKAEFMDAITRAKLRIEQYAAERLYDRDGCKGAEFNLRCNYGWTPPKEEEKADDGTTGVIALQAVMPAPEQPKEAEGE